MSEVTTNTLAENTRIEDSTMTAVLLQETASVLQDSDSSEDKIDVASKVEAPNCSQPTV